MSDCVLFAAFFALLGTFGNAIPPTCKIPPDNSIDVQFGNVTLLANKDYKSLLEKVFGRDFMSMPSIKDRYPKQGQAAFKAPEWVRAKYAHLYKTIVPTLSQGVEHEQVELKAKNDARKEIAQVIRAKGAIHRVNLITDSHQILDDHGKLIDVSPRVDIPNLLKQQRILLHLLMTIDRVLRKHGISYTISGGTLLGMHRHGGFIPWDGDVDITVSASAFKKMADLEASEWDSTPNPQMWYQTQKSDPSYNGAAAPYMAHLRWLESDYVEYKVRDWHNGLQVDIMKYA